MPPKLLGLPAAVREHSSPSARLAWLTLREADGPLSATALATETGASTDRIRRVLQALQEAGLVESRDHPQDGRRTLWSVAGDNRQLADAETAGSRRLTGLEAGKSASTPGGGPR